MKLRVYCVAFVFFTVLTLLGTFFYLFGESAFLFVDYSYYLLLSDGEETVEVVSVIDYDRGGAGLVYEGKSVLHYYPSFALAKGMAEKNASDDRSLSVKEICLKKLSLYGRDRGKKEEIRKRLSVLDSAALLLYKTANGLEDYSMGQENARLALSDCVALLDCTNETWEGTLGKKLFSMAEECRKSLFALEGRAIRANEVRKIGATLCLSLTSL